VRLGTALQLVGVPTGCAAYPRLVADGDGYRLARDRAGRAKVTSVELRTTEPSAHPSLTPPDERFLYGATSRRWKSVATHFGSHDRAWAVAIELCKAGIIEITCAVADGSRLGAPRSWRLTSAALDEGGRRARVTETAVAAAHAALEAAGLAEAGWADDWIAGSRRSGLLRRSAESSDELVRRAVACVAALPAVSGSPPIGRSELAATRAGGAHALDDGHRLTALVLRAAAAIVGADYPTTAAGRRQLWSLVGIVSDSVSATVLVANLRPSGNTLLSRHLRERADARLPTHLCARDLAHEPLVVPRCERVFACENPRVLEAALDAGATTTIICLQGNPTVVTLELLARLAKAGCTIAYRGDFDWPGIAIANRLIAANHCCTWLFDNQTYRRALRESLSGDQLALAGAAIEASWDPELTSAMVASGTAIHEEALLDHLVAFLCE
jgi:uncharacterized protein (TIGR02679 family)